MPAPKGTRVVTVPTSETDAVHIYSDEKRIWLQLRRNVRTKDDISAPSFKVSLTLSHEEAVKISEELRSIVQRQHAIARAEIGFGADGATAKPKAARKTKVATERGSQATPSKKALQMAVVPSAKREGGTPLRVCPKCSKEAAIQHNGGLWCTNCARIVVPPTIRPSSSRLPKPINRTVVVNLISNAPRNGTKKM